MPTGARRPCLTPGCPILVGRGATRCPVHEREHEAKDRTRRGSSAERGYDARWRAYRRAFLLANPVCVFCLEQGHVEPATVVDHIRSAVSDPELFWATSNHRALCKRCHDGRTDEGDFGR